MILHLEREGYFFYRLDTSDPEEWDKLVLEPAIAKVDAITEDRAEVRHAKVLRFGARDQRAAKGLQPCKQPGSSHLLAFPQPSEATEAVVSGADRLTTLINRHCDVCDRIINGDEAEWQVCREEGVAWLQMNE
jgi:hypothetical protein